MHARIQVFCSWLVVCGALACQRQSAPPRALARGTSRAVNGGAAARVHAVCDSIAASWHAVRFARVVTTDTMIFPLGGDSTARDVAACRVTATLDSTLDRASTPVLFWIRSNWPTDPVWLADGPDGQTKVYQRGFVRCEVAESWDGGDETDTTYAPSAWTEETSTCYQTRTPLNRGGDVDPGKASPMRRRNALVTTIGTIILRGRRDTTAKRPPR